MLNELDAILCTTDEGALMVTWQSTVWTPKILALVMKRQDVRGLVVRKRYSYTKCQRHAINRAGRIAGWQPVWSGMDGIKGWRKL